MQLLLHFKRENLFHKHSDIFNGRSQSQIVSLQLSNAAGHQLARRPLARVKEHHSLAKVNMNLSMLGRQPFATAMQHTPMKLMLLQPAPHMNTDKFQRRNSS
jgi:hypothetical protein